MAHTSRLQVRKSRTLTDLAIHGYFALSGFDGADVTGAHGSVMRTILTCTLF